MAADLKRRQDLQERTAKFARDVFALVECVPQTITNRNTVDQLTRSSGSVGANYIEANESLGRKDFLLHLRISRKEAKECRYWLELLRCSTEQKAERDRLMREATELLLIFSAIIRNCSKE